MRRILSATLTLTAAVTLAACGSATVDNTDAEDSTATSVAPLERGSGVASASTSSPAESDAEADAGGGQAAAPGAGEEPGAEDRGAHEVSSLPQPAPAGNEVDQGYLDQLRDGGIRIEGVEEQLIGAGRASCNPQDSVTIPAVAGQLIEQKRTDKPFEEVSALITDKAKAAYC